MYRSFSDRSSWVVSFDKTNIIPPKLAFGMSAPVRDPLYTSSSVLEWPSQTGDSKRRGAVIQLRGIILRSRLLKLAHVMCCPKLSQFVQQFLTRLVLAYPERANSWYAICLPSQNFLVAHFGLCSFDTEVAHFLRVVFEKVDIRDGIASYSTVWPIMKVCILSSIDQCRHLQDCDVELTRRWSLCRPIPQVQGVCSGHAQPVRKNVILSRQYRVLVLTDSVSRIDLESYRDIPDSYRVSSFWFRGASLSKRTADRGRPHQSMDGLPLARSIKRHGTTLNGRLILIRLPWREKISVS